MRRMATRVLLALALGLFGATAHAQFDDEFDEFEEPEPAPPEPVASDSPSEGAGAPDDEFSGFDDSAFDEPAEEDPADDEFEEDAFDDADEAEDEDEDADPTEEPREPEPDPRDDPWDARRLRLGNTFQGTTGGFHVPHALGLPAGTFQAQLGIEFFAKDGFLVEGDSHSRVGGALSLALGVHDLLEVYASLSSYATSNATEFPNLLIVLGDVMLGAKVGAFVSPTVAVGGDFALVVPTGTGLGPAFDAMGVRLRANVTADLRGRDDPLPLILRGTLGYTFDRSENLTAHVEDRRYDALPDAEPRSVETRHLISAAERNALSIDRTDFFHLGVGIEVPLTVAEDILVSPMVEYSLGVPVNRQSYQCLFVPGEAGSDRPADGADGCLANTGFASYPQVLTLGARVQPKVEGLNLFAAIDVGLSGRNRSQRVRELSQTAPWKLWLGLSYAHDARSAPIPPPITREVEVEVEVPADEVPGGRVRGRVVAREGGEPLADAIVSFIDREETALRVGPDGTFTTYRFSPGPVSMILVLAGHMPGRCDAVIPEEGGDQEVQCDLERQLVEIEDERVVILEKIQFAFDSAEILSESFGLMQQIATALNENPQIRRVEIQGHTDDQGDDQYNADLSQRRAESVMSWLVEHAVDAGRLRARGYGETQPLIRATTEEARAANRRVEFRIEQRDE